MKPPGHGPVRVSLRATHRPNPWRIAVEYVKPILLAFVGALLASIVAKRLPF